MTQTSRRNLISLILMIFIVIFSTFSTAITAYAKDEDIPIPQLLKDIYVYDADNIIDDDVEEQINKLLIDLKAKTGAEIDVFTVTSLLDLEIEDYSYELANALEIGEDKKDNGVVLLISKSDNAVRFEVGDGMGGCLTASKCGRLLDNYFVPYRDEGNYSEATYQVIKSVTAVVADYYETSILGIEGSLAEEIERNEEEYKRKSTIKIVIAIIVGIIILVLDQIFLNGTLLQILLLILSIFGGGKGRSGGGGHFSGGGASRK